MLTIPIVITIFDLVRKHKSDQNQIQNGRRRFLSSPRGLGHIYRSSMPVSTSVRQLYSCDQRQLLKLLSLRGGELHSRVLYSCEQRKLLIRTTLPLRSGRVLARRPFHQPWVGKYPNSLNSFRFISRVFSIFRPLLETLKSCRRCNLEPLKLIGHNNSTPFGHLQKRSRVAGDVTLNLENHRPQRIKSFLILTLGVLVGSDIQLLLKLPSLIMISS